MKMTHTHLFFGSLTVPFYLSTQSKNAMELHFEREENTKVQKLLEEVRMQTRSQTSARHQRRLSQIT